MVFADAPETQVPGKHDSHVLYYDVGVHDLHGQLDLNSQINEVYLAPGAWVKGGFKTTANHAVKIHGRGVIDNSPYPWHDDRFADAVDPAVGGGAATTINTATTNTTVDKIPLTLLR